MYKRKDGFSLIELLIVVVVIGILATLAAAGYFASRRSANEGSAISAMRLLHGAQTTYATSLGRGEYAGTIGAGTVTTLNDLHNANLIDDVLGSGLKSGYNYVGGREASTASAPAQFFFSSLPISTTPIAASGNHRFGIATDGVMRGDTNTSAQFADTAAVQSAPAWSN